MTRRYKTLRAVVLSLYISTVFVTFYLVSSDNRGFTHYYHLQLNEDITFHQPNVYGLVNEKIAITARGRGNVASTTNHQKHKYGKIAGNDRKLLRLCYVV